MREEFEAWATARAVGTPAGVYPQMLSRNPHDTDGYLMAWVDCAWMGWKSSRAALVIELPKINPQEWACTEDECLAIQQGLDMASRKIRAAGVKVKP